MYSNAINTVVLVCRAIKGLSTGPVLLKFQVLFPLSVLVLLHGLGQTAPNQHNENLSMCFNRKSFPSCRWKGCTNVAQHLEARKTAAVRCLFLERITQQIHKLLGSFLVKEVKCFGVLQHWLLLSPSDGLCVPLDFSRSCDMVLLAAIGLLE